MDSALKNKLVFTLTLSNTTDTTFWLDNTALESTPQAFPSKLLPLSTQVITLEGDPQLPQGITIDYDVKKTVFTTQAVYTNYRQTVQLRTDFQYSYRKRLNHRPPQTEFFWEHHALSTGRVPVFCQSFIDDKSSNYPYNYSMFAFIAPM